jgi:hypothetical protein
VGRWAARQVSYLRVDLPDRAVRSAGSVRAWAFGNQRETGDSTSSSFGIDGAGTRMSGRHRRGGWIWTPDGVRGRLMGFEAPTPRTARYVR